MKNRFLRGTIGMLLAFCILALPAASIGASAQTNEDRPYIYVPGFMGNNVYLNPGTDEQELLFPPSTERIMSTLKGCVGPLTRFIITGDWNSLGKTLAPLVYDLLSPVYNGQDGSPSSDSGPNWSYPDADSLTCDGKYTFEYDWRLDPIEIAAQLKSFVDYIKLNTGSAQVDIRCHSMGGVVMLCYLNLYGYDDLHAVMYDTTAIYGETFNGELFTNQIELSDKSILSYMKYVFFGSEYEVFLNNMAEALYKLGIIDNVCDLGNIILEHSYDDIARVVVPMFAYYPGIWAMIPDEYIHDARDYVFGELLNDGETDYSVLKAKLDNYDANIREGKGEKLLDSAVHMRVGVISRYNFSSIPATKSWYTMSDATVDSKASSFGATYAKYGETLSDDYIATLSTTKYLSPDKAVDASTALFPDNTWFIKDLPHSRHCETLSELTELFFKCENEIDIDTDARFPQFMIFDSKSECAYPMEEDDVMNGRYTDGSMEEFKIIAFVKKIINRFIAAFDSLFKYFGC